MRMQFSLFRSTFKTGIHPGYVTFERWTWKPDKSRCCLIYWNRIWKPWLWLGFHTNGAVKGKDNCLDMSFRLFIFEFTYTDFSYWRFIPSNIKEKNKLQEGDERT